MLGPVITSLASSSALSTSPEPPDEVSFGLSPSYGLLTARKAHDWFLEMMRGHGEFEVETDKAGEGQVPICV